MINLEELIYKSFGKCLRITNGKVEAIVTLEIGPRVIRFSRVGGENVFLEDEGLTINHDDKKEEYAKAFGEDLGAWAIIGGHRVWAAIERLPRTYYPSCASEYEKIENGVRVVAPIQRWTNLQPEIDLIFVGDDEIKVVNRWRNCGAWPVEFAVWALSVADKGGVEIIPQSDRQTGLLHNRVISLWDYTHMNDERVTWGDRYIKVRQDSSFDYPFKLGVSCEKGFVLYFNKGDLFVKKFDAVVEGNYPDGGVNFESYTNEHFLEIESLGELKTVDSGEISEHTEYWKIFGGIDVPKTDEEIDEVIKKYV